MMRIKNIFKMWLFNSLLLFDTGLFAASQADSDLDRKLFESGMHSLGIGYIYKLAISPDGKFLISIADHQVAGEPFFDSSDDETDFCANRVQRVSMWDLESRTLIGEIRGLEGVCALAISPNNRILAAKCNKEVKLIDLKTMKCIHRFNTQTSLTNMIAFSPDGDFLAFNNKHEMVDDIELWNLTTMTCTHQIKYDYEICALVFDQKGNILVTCPAFRGNNIKVISLEFSKCIHEMDMSRVSHFYGYRSALSSDGSFLIFSGEKGKIELFNLKSMTCTCVFNLGHLKITELALNLDGTKIAVALNKDGFGSILILPNNFVRERKNAILALAHAMHPRLGIDSPAQSLTGVTLQLIYDMYDTNVQIGEFYPQQQAPGEDEAKQLSGKRLQEDCDANAAVSSAPAPKAQRRQTEETQKSEGFCNVM